MKIDDFLEFNKYDLEDCIANNPTTFTIKRLKQAIADCVIILKPLRTSKERTKKAIKIIFENHSRKIPIYWIDDDFGNKIADAWKYERTADYDIIKLWLTKFFDLNDSYYYAYNTIVPYYNENGFLISYKDKTQKELMEAIRLDDSPEAIDTGKKEVVEAIRLDGSPVVIDTGNNLENEVSTAIDLGKFNFDQSTLSILHGLFNEDEKLWEKISITGYYDNFKEIPALTLILKNKIAFSYLIRKYDNKQIGISHMQNWFKSHFCIDNTSNSINRLSYSERNAVMKDKGGKFSRRTEEDILIEYIDNKLKPI